MSTGAARNLPSVLIWPFASTSKPQVVKRELEPFRIPGRGTGAARRCASPYLPVTYTYVTEELGRPLGGVLDPTVFGKGPVLYDQRNLARIAEAVHPAGQRTARFVVVAPIAVVAEGAAITQEVDASVLP